MARIHREREAMQVLAPLLPAGAVPEVLFSAPEEYAFAIPSRQLERGRLPPHIAAAQFDAATRSRQ